MTLALLVPGCESVHFGGSGAPAEPTPRACTLFAQLAKPFIVPVNAPREGIGAVFDLEGNGLLETITCVHCIVISELGSDRVYEYGPRQIADALAHLKRADTLIGHNVQSYDLPVLRKLFGWAPPATCRIVDTLIAGRLILPNLSDIDVEVAARIKDAAFNRLRGSQSLEAWGVRLGIAKVGAELEQWSEWTPEIQARCTNDVRINTQLWLFLQPNGCPRGALELEHRTAAICEQITTDGAPFDTRAAEPLSVSWKARRAELAAQLRKQFPTLKNPNSRPQIGALLEAHGCQFKKRTEKTNRPVIDKELLGSLPEVYPELAGLSEYYTLGQRLGSLVNGKEAWVKHVRDGRIHGGLMHIGTPHSRAKHFKPNLAGVPNPKKGSAFGAECRALFCPADDWVIIVCDQSTLQDRGFAHYLAAYDDGAYARTLVDGKLDQHWHTATALGLVPENTARDKNNRAHTVIREGAKTFRYAFLFGAGEERSGQNIANIVQTMATIAPDSALCEKVLAGNKHPNEAALKQIGQRARNKFIAATPGLRELRQRLSKEHRRNGWIEGLDGRRVPTGADYKALNRIVTSSEAIICKRWLIDVHTELCARFRYGPNGDAYIALWIHDEIAVCCRPEIAAEIGELLVRHGRVAGEPYGFSVPLNAEYKVGRDWAGTALETETIATDKKIVNPEIVGPEINPEIVSPEINPEIINPEIVTGAAEIEASWPDDF